MPCQYSCTVDIAFNTFVLISLLLYILLTVVIVKFRKEEAFRSAFFTFIVNLAVSDIISTVIVYMNNKIPFWGFFSEFYLHPATGYLLHFGWYMHLAQVTGVLLITINRFTALVTPTKHATVWQSSGRVRGSILLSWLIPVAVCLPLFFTGLRYGYSTAAEDSISGLSDARVRLFYLAVGLVGHVSVTAALGLMYGAMLVTLCSWRRTAAVGGEQCAPPANNNLAHSQSRSRMFARSERKLAVSGFVMFVLLGCCTFYSWWRTSSQVNEVYAEFFFFIFNDLFSIINPYILLATSEPVRLHFGYFVRCHEPPRRRLPRLPTNVRMNCHGRATNTRASNHTETDNV